MSVIPNSVLPGTINSPIYREIKSPRLARPSSRFTGMHVHFVGIGGSGMSGLARMLIDCGAIVTGSDRKTNRQIAELMQLGARISFEQRGELLAKDTNLVVRTAAVKEEHPEMEAAREHGLETIKYAQLLGEVMRERHGVAIAGTHGKSTTTAMTAYALLKCGLDPSFVVGGIVPQLGNVGSRSGGGESFIAEACEYDRSFHNLAPRVAVITNIEEDHLDCYKNIYEIIESFRKFVKLVPSDGLIIANGRDPNVAKVFMDATCRVETVSIGGDTTWCVYHRGIVDGCPQGQVCYNGKPVATLRLSVAGDHNLFNATVALASAVACGADIVAAAEALSQFKGVDRRMTPMGSVNGATIVDDYAHHPTEIRTTLKALRERYAPKRLFCVFQPHQHSRTRHLIEDFATSFSAADQVVMPDIYFVRDSEDERRSVCSDDLVKKIVNTGHNALHISSFSDIVAHLRSTLTAGDLVVTMGAGDVNQIAADLAEVS